MLKEFHIHFDEEQLDTLRAYHGNSFTLPPLGKSIAPTAVAAFPRDVLPVPRKWVERNYPVIMYTEMPRGGHLPRANGAGLFLI